MTSLTSQSLTDRSNAEPKVSMPVVDAWWSLKRGIHNTLTVDAAIKEKNEDDTKPTSDAATPTH